MLNRKNTAIAAAIVMMVAVVVLTGCQDNKKGSNESLKNQTTLSIESVIWYLQPDGSKYYTEQSYSVFPQLKTILLIADEPQGRFGWSILNGSYTAPDMTKGIPTSADLMFDEGITKALFALYTTNPISGKVKSNPDETLNLDGVIFDKVDLDLEDVTLFSDQSTGRANTARVNGEKTFILRAYNYQRAKKLGILVPTKIDVYYQKNANNRPMIAQFNCTITEK